MPEALSESVTFADVEGAAARVAGRAHRTPVATSRTLDARLSCRLFFKCENLQRAGSFKFRGAFNAMAQLDAGARSRGVLAYSSGNHAQAVALAGRELGIATTIIMPTDAPLVKQRATRGYGGDVVLYDRSLMIDTMVFLWQRMKLIVEPTGVLGIAAALHGVVAVDGRRVGVVLSGGNVELGQAGEWFKGRL